MGKKAKISIIVALSDKPALEGLKSLTGRFLDFSKSVDPAIRVVGGAVRGLSVVLGVATSALTASTAQAIQFERAMREVTTIADSAAFPLERVRAISFELAKTYGGSLPGNAKTLYEIISAGVTDSAAAMETLHAANKLAIGGLTSTGIAVDGLTSLLNAFSAQGARAGDVTDAMFVAIRDGKTTAEQLSQSIGLVGATAAAAGLDVDELLAAVATMTTQGIKTASATEYLRSALANVIKPSRQAIATARDLGIAFDAQALATKGLARFLDDVVRKSGATRQQLSQLFGDVGGLTGVFALTAGEGAKLTAVLADMSDKSGSADRAFQTMSATLGHQLDVFAALREAASTAFGGTVAEAEGVRETVKAVNGALGDLVEFLNSDEGRHAVAQAFDTLLYELVQLNKVILGVAESFDDLRVAYRLAASSTDLVALRFDRLSDTWSMLAQQISNDQPESPLLARLRELNAELEGIAKHRVAVDWSQAQSLAEDVMSVGTVYQSEPLPERPQPAADSGKPKKENAAQRKARLERERMRRQDAEALGPVVGSINGVDDARTAGLQGAIDVDNANDLHNVGLDAEREYRGALAQIDLDYLDTLTAINNDVAAEQRRGPEAVRAVIEDLSSGLEGFVDLMSGETSEGAAQALSSITNMVVGSFTDMVAGIASGSTGVLDAIGGFVGGIITSLGMMLIQLGTAAILANALSVIPIFAGLVGPPGVGAAVGVAAVAAGAIMVGIGSALGGASSGSGATPSVAAGGRGRGSGRSAQGFDSTGYGRNFDEPFGSRPGSGVSSRGVPSTRAAPVTYVTSTTVNLGRGMVVASSTAAAGRELEGWLDAAARLRGQSNPWRRQAA